MDPRTAYADMLDALDDGDVHDAGEHALDLKEWAVNGGYLHPKALEVADAVVLIVSHMHMRDDDRTFDVMADVR